jgi:SAM-dependent methyltransferase
MDLMAKIEFIHPASKDFPRFTETIEARPWGLAGTVQQQFYIGSGVNFRAAGTLWLEIVYSVEQAQVFYTRNFLHHELYSSESIHSLENHLDELVQQGEGQFVLGYMLPETGLRLTLEKHTYQDENDKEAQSTYCTLEISTDTGAVFGRTGPGQRFVDIKLDLSDIAEGVRFMRELIHEIESVQQGKHPDPASFPDGSSEWPFIWQLNQLAYNKIAEAYQEDYFKNPLLTKIFDGWLARIPINGQILDAGCGHGHPVITRLLQKGYRVTGSDFSEGMLRRASQQFPQVTFIQKTTTMIRDQAAFDGICSFNSTLYLDPIDLLHSIFRFNNALKPGGLLFLYGFDSGPDWRGEPFSHTVGQWMWSWHYGIDEAASLLEEHKYFKVIKAQKVQVDEKEAERITQELEKQKLEEAEFNQRQKSDQLPFPQPFFKTPVERSPYAYVVIARRGER